MILAPPLSGWIVTEGGVVSAVVIVPRWRTSNGLAAGSVGRKLLEEAELAMLSIGEEILDQLCFL